MFSGCSGSSARMTSIIIAFEAFQGSIGLKSEGSPVTCVGGDENVLETEAKRAIGMLGLGSSRSPGLRG